RCRARLQSRSSADADRYRDGSLYNAGDLLSVTHGECSRSVLDDCYACCLSCTQAMSGREPSADQLRFRGPGPTLSYEVVGLTISPQPADAITLLCLHG